MIILPTPPKKMWEQNNKSDVLGTLWSSFGLNLTEQLGKTKVSSRMVMTTSSFENQFSCPVAFKKYGSNIYFVSGDGVSSPSGYLYQSAAATPESAFSRFTLGGNPNGFDSDFSDLEVFNNRLYISGAGASNWWRYDGSAFTSLGNSHNTGNYNHKMLASKMLNRLYFADNYTQVLSIDTGETTATTGNQYTFLITNTDLFISTLLETSDSIWICTFNGSNAPGYVYKWDGSTANGGTTANSIPLDSRGAMAGIVKDGTPYIIDADGKLMYYNGGAFVMAPNGRLPVKQFKYLKNPFTPGNNRWIHPNGITLVDNRINILINNENYDATKTIQESLPSGIWEYDPDIGWYHKDPMTLYNYGGTKVINDYGQNRISRVGALYNAKIDNSTSDAVVGTLLAGATVYTDATTTLSAVFTNDSLDTLQKYGYFVTSKIMSPVIQESWERLFLRIRPLLTSTDKIVVKYRSDESPATETASITWINYNSFTTTTDLSSYAIGNEVEITQGPGSGMCSHITSLTNNAGTWTVVVDEQYPNVSGTGRARFQTWKKLDSFNTQGVNLVQFGSMENSPWIQIKVCMLYTGNNEIIDLIIKNGTYQ